MRRLLILPLLTLGAWASTASAEPTKAAEPVTIVTSVEKAAKRVPTAEELRLAAELIDVIHPDQDMFESNMRGWEAVSRKTAVVDPLFSKLEAEFPGSIDAAIKNAYPAATEYARDFVRKAKSKKTSIFAECLTAAEMQELIAFFRQPVGQRLALRLQAPGDVDEFADRVVAKAEEGDSAVTTDDLQQSLRKQSRIALKEMSTDDVLAIARFERQPVAKKFAAAGAQADLAILEIINNPDPAALQKMGEAAMDGAIKFVEAKKTAQK